MKRFDDECKSLYRINRDSVHELVLARPVAHNVACIAGNSIAIDLYWCILCFLGVFLRKLHR